jgi:hypothetical protein
MRIARDVQQAIKIWLVAAAIAISVWLVWNRVDEYRLMRLERDIREIKSDLKELRRSPQAKSPWPVPLQPRALLNFPRPKVFNQNAQSVSRQSPVCASAGNRPPIFIVSNRPAFRIGALNDCGDCSNEPCCDRPGGG